MRHKHRYWFVSRHISSFTMQRMHVCNTQWESTISTQVIEILILWILSNSFLIPITHIIWISDWHAAINSQCYKLHLWPSLLWSFWNIKRYLIYTTIACRLCFSQSVTRSNSFDWQNMQEKDSSVITAQQSTKQLTLALGIFKLRRITWPFL